MTSGRPHFVVLMFCATATYGQPSQNPYYAGRESPLVKLGAQRVLKTINYPEWFQYPAMPASLRQLFVDNYTTREFLISFDTSAANAPATKYNEAAQLIGDLLSAYGGNRGSLSADPTRKEINDALRKQLVPKLVKPREENELDSPSSNEYSGASAGEIKLLDQEIAYWARKNNIPTGYRPPSSFLTPQEREARQRNEETIRRETLSPSVEGRAKSVTEPPNSLTGPERPVSRARVPTPVESPKASVAGVAPKTPGPVSDCMKARLNTPGSSTWGCFVHNGVRTMKLFIFDTTEKCLAQSLPDVESARRACEGPSQDLNTK